MLQYPRPVALQKPMTETLAVKSLKLQALEFQICLHDANVSALGHVL